MTRPLVILTLAVGLSLGATGAVLVRWHGERTAGANARDAVKETGVGHPIYALDPRDDLAMAAYATDIFIGRVLGQTADACAPTSAPGQEVPQSQFAVEVLHAVKGEAEGVVTINQVGGLDAQARRLMLLDGDTLLRAGRSELFLVVYVPEMEWYQIVAAGHGHLPADDAAEREALIDRFTQAAVPSETDEASSHTRPHGERS
ncbi:MAG: hypothetical protein KY456_01465 [Chloroflexi bacterium]|nr:hypothetical protein [Chloroflexota bacterium]